ncbi:collagen-like protein [Streptomyces sp. NBRC 110611]|nr:collagen-like protein [Streptomyces sp. NBRC 110611]
MLCLGALLTGCGSTPEKGYAALGAAGPGDEDAPTRPIPPQDGVQLTPLENQGDPGGRAGQGQRSTPDGTGGPGGLGRTGGPGRPGGGIASANGRPGPSTPPTGPDTDGHPRPPTPPSPPSPAPPAPSSPSPPSDPTSPSGSPKPPFPTTPAGPNAPDGLLIGKPRLADTDVRWCERVTLDFLNTGSAPVTAGTVTFGTHLIGPLGIDWATATSRHKLPLPLNPGERKSGTWRVCVAAWRVPPGMRIDTQDATFTWQ